MSIIDEVRIIAPLMVKYGGSFAAALGRVIWVADDNNLQRIKDAFPELWAEYLDAHKKLAQMEVK